jgi:hypothetical protein
VPVVEDAETERLGQRQRAAGGRPVVAQQAVGVGEAGDRQAVLGFPVVDAVPAGEVRVGLGADVGAPAQHLGRELEGDQVARPGQQVDRQQRLAAHRVDVRQRVGGGDPAPVVGVVDDRGEEVGGGDDRAAAVDADRGPVIAVLDAHEQVAPGAPAREARENPFELPGRDLAGTPPAGGVLREAEVRGGGCHGPQRTSA